MRLAGYLFSLLLVYCVAGPEPWHWIWNRVPDADVDHYRVESAYLDPNPYPCTRTECGIDCDPAEVGCCVEVSGLCVSYSLSSWALSATEPQLPDSEVDVCTDWDSGEQNGWIIPPVGSVLFVNIRAVDTAGNVGN